MVYKQLAAPPPKLLQTKVPRRLEGKPCVVVSILTELCNQEHAKPGAEPLVPVLLGIILVSYAHTKPALLTELCDHEDSKARAEALVHLLLGLKVEHVGHSCYLLRLHVRPRDVAHVLIGPQQVFVGH